jgi:YHS domain-containing protein
MKAVFILLILYLVYLVAKGFMFKGLLNVARKKGAEAQQDSRTAHEGQGEKGEEMVQDPVCSSYVPISSAVSVSAPEGMLYFCSDECRDKFAAKTDK